MALILKDLNGNAYPVETVTNHTVRMNSDGMLTFNVIENEQTAHFINDISKMWRVENVTGDAESQTYVIVIAKRKATKHKQYIEVTAKEEQFDYLETHRIYENVTGSRIGVDFLNLIFDGTPYSYTLLEGVYAKEWENAGDGQSRFEMFLNWLERYGFEFQYEPTSKTFKLGERISRRPAYYISKKLNANDISFEEDATNFYTYARGYFDYDGEDNIHAANQIREYPKDKASPMIELFGIREAPPVSDGRVTDTELMDEMLEKQVEQSLKMSIELDFVTLGHNYPFAQPEIGDEIPVIDETINFNRVLRIQEIKTTRDAHHKVIKQTIVVGDPRREVRYKKAQAGAASAINDLMAGRTKIKESVLPAAIKESTQMLMDTSSELSFSEQGIMAVDKDNPNYVTLLNSSGLGVSKDGGQTFHNAITRGQINADLITAGSLNADYIRGGALDANLVNIIGGDGLITMNGDEFKAFNNTSKSQTVIKPSGLYVTRPDGAEWVANGVPKMALDIQRNPFMEYPVEFGGQNYLMSTEIAGNDFKTFENFFGTHQGRYLRVTFGVSLNEKSESNSAFVECRLQEFGAETINKQATTKVIAYTPETGETSNTSLQIDLGVPNYQDIQYYIQFRATDKTYINLPQVRVNRVYVYG